MNKLYTHALLGAKLGQAWLTVYDTQEITATYSYQDFTLDLHSYPSQQALSEHLLGLGVLNALYKEALRCYKSYQLWLATKDTDTPEGVDYERSPNATGSYDNKIQQLAHNTLDTLNSVVRSKKVTPHFEDYTTLLQTILHYHLMQQGIADTVQNESEDVTL